MIVIERVMKELLNDVDKLKGLIASVEREELISIHFFSEAFDLLYKVQEGLIALESEQIERLHRDIEMRKLKLSGLKNGISAPLEEQDALSIVTPSDLELALPVLELPEEAIAKNPIVSDTVMQVVEDIATPVAPSVPVEEKTVRAENKDIRVLLSLNDRFRFQRELFDGNALAFNSFLDRLNSMESLADATGFIRSETNRSEEDEITVELYTVLERLFSGHL